MSNYTTLHIHTFTGLLINLITTLLVACTSTMEPLNPFKSALLYIHIDYMLYHVIYYKSIQAGAHEKNTGYLVFFFMGPQYKSQQL